MAIQLDPAITAIATVLPEGRVSNLSAGERFGFGEEFIRDKIGFMELRKSSSDFRTGELAASALKKLQQETGLDWSTIDCLVVCTQNPDSGGLPNTASMLHGEFGLPVSCAAFDISLGCSGYIYGLAVLKSFMMLNGMRRGILVTADPYSKIIRPEDRDTALLFGDGAAATLMETDGQWDIGRFVLGSDGTRREAIAVQDDGFLKMNGRQVFAFSAQTVPGAIADALDRNGIASDEIELFLVHQGSRYIVEELRRRLNVAPDRMPFAATEMGNLVSSSVPFLLAPVLSAARGPILLAGFGVGLSWGVTCLTRRATITTQESLDHV